MAVDKKSQHVGTHGGIYQDIDGQTKQFTYVDHDRHTTRTKLGREYKEPIPIQLSPEDKLIQDIILSGTNLDDYFIISFDELGKKYGFERFRRGTYIESAHMKKGPEDIGWYKDLETIFKKSLKETKIKSELFLKTVYG